MSKPLVWITGAGGLIGNCLGRTAPRFAPEWQVHGLTRDELDLADFAAVSRAFMAEKPALVIHCAALSKSPACQAAPALAALTNIHVTDHLCGLAGEIPLLFFSTDLVFDGRKGHYVETDPVNPLSVYGETKARAEERVRANPRHTVIRTSLNGGTSPTADRGFNEAVRGEWQQGRTTRFFTDEFRSPIAAIETARAVWELVARRATGVFHVAGSERLSRWQIGELLASRWPQLQPKLEPGLLRDHVGPPRSPDTSLDCTKAQACLSFPLPGLTEWLRQNPHEPF